MRIGITCYPTYGGSGIVATELGMELAQRGHEIHFISYANPIRLDPETPGIYYHEVEVSTYPLFQYPPYSLALASRMAEVAEQRQLDLLHVHYAIPHSISALLAQQMTPERRLPFITTLHGTDITLVGADPNYFPITKFSMERSDGITTISEYMRQRTVEFFGIRNPIEVIPNFVNCSLYRPDREAQRKGLKRILHISNFRPVKRVLDCMHVFAKVRQSVEAELVMAGDGPDRGPAERLARDLRIEKYVRFLGKQDHMERLIPRMNALHLPSEMEAFGLAALEAMACGVPPVATRTGGVPDLITHRVDGYLEPVGDIEAQAQRLTELLTNDKLHGEISEAARKTAQTRFCTDLIIPRYEEYYERVCGSNGTLRAAAVSM
ncbi:MAG: N-acetyl-alpha-D-glucosaminyl L-malate synthase BshA [Acidobacteriaceae bacterium]|nr:N-acetyl-alpha-D-glucosaminyl L-malate synthase BshA [Acidobacteriaceae bacterium]MBV9296531.1 N-acetyl-alpha-D-glucosaminyl L-malate synthase BshA [Acidobacteriaceae bacterium]MBV9765551.1 N-acetyl-alpha-D-glucosaminyl L-malate synthase BshA [Acidobacteriaceae bacterium]